MKHHIIGIIGVGAIVVASFCWNILRSPKAVDELLFTPRYPDVVLTKSALSDAQPNASLNEEAPVSALVGHHLLAAELFRDTLKKIPSQKIRHVILIAPNHFLEGRGRIQTIDQSFSTPYGLLPINHALVRALVADGAATREPNSFYGEHGVANIVPMIKKLLPEADVTPIIVWEGISTATLERVRQSLKRHIQPDTLILGSFDFSHYVPSLVANEADEKTKAMLNQRDIDHIQSSAVDSPTGLWLWLALTLDQGGQRFVLDSATNSGIITQSPIETEVTSYINGRFFR